jgi:2-polyprenyl-3-methyl-5-hydroxy-6-metoxy-1,4-benzoquinol methylase
MVVEWKQFLPPDARPYGCCNPRILAAVGCEEKFWADFLQMSCLYHVEQYHQLRGEGGWAFHERAVEIAQAQGPHFFTGRMKCWRGYMAAALIANGVIQFAKQTPGYIVIADLPEVEELAYGVKMRKNDLTPFPFHCREWSPARTEELFPGFRACEAELLPKVGCGNQAWAGLMTALCTHCRDSVCGEHALQPAALAVDTALAGESDCLRGRLAAAMVFNMHRWDVPGFNVHEYDGVDLTPFPLDSCAAGLLRPLPIGVKGGHPTAACEILPAETWVPAVPANDFCAVNISPASLACACRRAKQKRKARGEAVAQPPLDWRCPSFPANRTYEHYARRARDAGCESDEALWSRPLNKHHHCVLISVGQRLGFFPGARVLDLGTGCGHFLTWARAYFGVEGYGVDLTPEAIAWAQNRSAGKFCHGDVRDLSWVPDESFDFVISYGVANVLGRSGMCTFARNAVRKLKPSGRAWLGMLNVNTLVEVRQEDEWDDCFQRVFPDDPRALFPVHLRTEEDYLLFAPSYERSGSFQFLPPAHSLFVDREEASPLVVPR